MVSQRMVVWALGGAEATNVIIELSPTRSESAAGPCGTPNVRALGGRAMADRRVCRAALNIHGRWTPCDEETTPDRATDVGSASCMRTETEPSHDATGAYVSRVPHWAASVTDTGKTPAV